jgi:hypothetical protein
MDGTDEILNSKRYASRDVMGWLFVCGKGNRLGLLSRKKTGRTIDGGFGRCRLCNNRRTDSVRVDLVKRTGWVVLLFGLEIHV